MSDTEVVETTEEVTEKTDKEETKEAAKPSRADWEAKQVEKASKSGWKDFDDYVAEGGDPEKWKTADAFNTYGELIGTIHRQKKDFEQRIEGIQTLTKAQLETQRQQLTAQREALIEEGGKVKEVRALDKQIQNLEVPVAAPVNSALDNWNSENQWIFEDTPKSAYAKDVFGREVRAGKSIEAAISAVEAGIKKHYPPTTQRTVTVPETERGNGSKGFTKQAKNVTMADLTAEERHIWNHSGSMWGGDEKKFLQSVQDIRNAERGSR